ncbi:MAG: hypothetical protein M3Q79_02235 [bacterium]|nr:hypothetical protein [bacterium]
MSALSEILDYAETVNYELVDADASLDDFKKNCVTLTRLASSEGVIGRPITSSGEEFITFGGSESVSTEQMVFGRFGGFILAQEYADVDGLVLERSSVAATVVKPTIRKTYRGYLCPVNSNFVDIEAEVDDTLVSDLHAEIHDESITARSLVELIGKEVELVRVAYLNSVLSPRMLAQYLRPSIIYFTGSIAERRVLNVSLNENDTFSPFQIDQARSLVIRQAAADKSCMMLELSANATFLP